MIDKDTFEDEVNRLVKLGGQLRDLSRAKEALHNTATHAGPQDRLAEGSVADRQLRILDTAKEVQERLWEAFQDAQKPSLIVNGTLSASSLEGPVIFDPEDPVPFEDLDVGDVVNVFTRSGQSFLGATVAEILSEVPYIRSDDLFREMPLITSDTVYRAQVEDDPEPEPEEPEEPFRGGTLVDVTDLLPGDIIDVKGEGIFGSYKNARVVQGDSNPYQMAFLVEGASPGADGNPYGRNAAKPFVSSDIIYLIERPGL